MEDESYEHRIRAAAGPLNRHFLRQHNDWKPAGYGASAVRSLQGNVMAVDGAVLLRYSLTFSANPETTKKQV
jgi:hypothetical protein